MLRKMYIDSFEVANAHRPQDERTEGLKPKKLDFQFYWNALTKSRWPVALFTAFITALAILYSQTATPIYSASATLLLESQKANIISIEELVSSEQESLDYFGTQIAILKSRALAERVMRKLEQDEDISQERLADVLTLPGLFDVFKGDAQAESTEPSVQTTADETAGTTIMADRNRRSEYEELLALFRQTISIKAVVNTKLVTVSFNSVDPEFSAMVANTIAQQYIDSVLERRMALEDQASEWMNARIVELRAELNESEDALLSFKLSNGLVELSGGISKLNEQELLLTSSELALARNELLDASDVYREIQKYRDTAPQLLETLPFVQSDALVRTVMAELGDVQRDLVESRNRYGAKNPRIIDAESRLESLSATLREHINRIVTTFENDYQLLRQRVASLEANLAVGKENMQLIGQQQIALDTLEREVDANREQYNRLYDRITETRTADGLNEANAVVAEAAWVPTEPVKPNKKLIIGLALLGSLTLVTGFAFIREFMDDTVNSVDDVERRLRTKLLGVFPLVGRSFLKRKNAQPLGPDYIAGKSEAYAEAVNTCRTELMIGKENDPQIILVTSSVRSEGKSTVAMNLAHSFGQLKPTLLIDCDLRRPSLANALEVSAPDTGLTALLDGHYVDCVKFNVLGAFDLLTSGPIPKQPLEVLSSPKFATVLKNLRKHYSKIIIDSPPTQVVSDSLVLSKLADSVLYVVEPHKTSIKLVDSGISRLTEAGASIAGVCVSQVDTNRPKSYSGFEFHGSGVDYVGYGDDRGQESKVDRQIKIAVAG